MYVSPPLPLPTTAQEIAGQNYGSHWETVVINPITTSITSIGRGKHMVPWCKHRYWEYNYLVTRGPILRRFWCVGVLKKAWTHVDGNCIHYGWRSLLYFFLRRFWIEISNRNHWTDPQTWVSNSSIATYLKGCPLGFGPIQLLMDSCCLMQGYLHESNFLRCQI